ncbi:hypothetical protein DTO217A2_5928 [Paecilomyces variotii]|nr:hypothetical protein DTO217A2_5928 [Paecilomyces variotii]
MSRYSLYPDHLDTVCGNDQNIGLAYIYFNFRRSHKQRLEDVLESLLKQLTQGRPSLLDRVKALYHQHYEGGRPSDFSNALQTVISGYMKVFIIVDALDECQSTDRSRDRHLKISNFKPGLTLASLPRLDLYQELRRDLKEYLLWRLERVVMTLRNTYRALLVDFRGLSHRMPNCKKKLSRLSQMRWMGCSFALGSPS